MRVWVCFAFFFSNLCECSNFMYSICFHQLHSLFFLMLRWSQLSPLGTSSHRLPGGVSLCPCPEAACSWGAELGRQPTPQVSVLYMALTNHLEGKLQRCVILRGAHSCFPLSILLTLTWTKLYWVCDLNNLASGCRRV